MANLPNLRVENFGGSLKVLFVDNTHLTNGRRSTYLTEDIVSAASTIRVQSVVGFESLTTSSGQVVLLGEIGGERTELLRTSNATPPGPGRGEVTLRDTTVFDHPQDTKVYIVDWNRVEFDYAATAAGTKTTLVAYAVAITPDQKETLFRDTTESANRLAGAPATAFYFARFNESVGGRNGDWSDAAYGGGYADNTVAAVKKRALDELGEEVDGVVITHEFLNQCLWEARREYHNAPGKRPFRRKYNVVLDNVTTGSYRIALPADVERPETAENVYGIRVGTEANMAHYDKKEWDFDYRNIAHSETTAAYATDSRDIYVVDASDFDETGVVSIAQTNIEYSAKSVSGGTLRISVQGSYAVSTGADVWQNVTYGLPDKFTVFATPGGSAYVYFNMPFSTTYVDQNVYADYFRTVVDRDSDNDLLDEPNYDLFVPYIKAKIKHRKNKGAGDITQDSDYKLWEFKKGEALAREYLGTAIRIAPNVDAFDLPE